MNLSESDLSKLDQIKVKPTLPEPYKEPVKRHERLEYALKILPENIRGMVRNLYWRELAGMSIFWDEVKKEIEFVGPTIILTINENGFGAGNGLATAPAK